MNDHLIDFTGDLSETTACSSIISVDTKCSSVNDSDVDVSLRLSKKMDNIGDSLSETLKVLFKAQKYDLAIALAENFLDTFPSSPFLHNMLGEAYAALGKHNKAVENYESFFLLSSKGADPDYVNSIRSLVHNNLAISYRRIGLFDEADTNFKRALEVDQNFALALNNYGNLLYEQNDILGSKQCFLKSISIDPSDASAYWNLLSVVEDTEHAKDLISLSIEQNPNFSLAVKTLAGMLALEGNFEYFDGLAQAYSSDDAIISSFLWLLSLPRPPKIYFSRWSMFDLAISEAAESRPCYEYGVWMGNSLRYLMKSFTNGFGFDTFDGLPEDWGPVPKGTYSSFGDVPKIENVEFIVGRFEETLPDFFSTHREKAGLINFDADLYSSTACALHWSADVIDSDTVLVFDEFIVNEGWKNDEYKALMEYCDKHSLSMDVIAASIFTKQVVCKLMDR